MEIGAGRDITIQAVEMRGQRNGHDQDHDPENAKARI